MALLLSGCFRPSGDTIEPTAPGATADTSNQPLSNATATPEAPPITLLSPDVTSAPTNAPTLSGPVITEVTIIPFESTATATAPAGSLTPTLQFITPGISLGQVTPETTTPVPDFATLSVEGLETIPSPNTGNDTGNDTGTSVELVSGAECTYTVEPGDNLYRIAILNNTSVNAMMEANPQLVGDPPILQPGQVLALPDCTPGGSVSAEEPTEAATLRADSTALPAGQTTYRVQPGDTLMSIASRYNTTIQAIVNANNLSNPDMLSIGQTLIIPNQPEDDGQ
jgi:LysM repeat protein